MKRRAVPLPKPEPGAKFKPGDFEDILQNIPDTCVLIGGQAVAWWAEKYALTTPEGERVDATSKDIDFWGRHADLKQIANRLRRVPYIPDKREMTSFVGAIEITAAGKKTALEILYKVPGLDSKEPESVALPETMTKSGKEALVLTPVSLVLTKLYNLCHFDQKDRHDLLHLQISLQASRPFISELIERDARFALWNCNRLIKAHRSKANRRLEREHLFRILSAIPIESIQTASRNTTLLVEERAKLKNFLTFQWPRIQA